MTTNEKKVSELLRSMSFSEKIQTIIWLLSMVGVGTLFVRVSIQSFRAGVDLLDNAEFALVILLGFGMIIQQFMIYIHIIRLEQEPTEQKSLYGSSWIDNGWEKLIRYALLISLLLCAGQLTSSFELMLPPSPTGKMGLVISSLITSNGDKREIIFFVGALLVSLCQLVWNTAAYVVRRRRPKGEFNAEIEKHIRKRITSFAYSGAIAFSYWAVTLITIVFSNSSNQDWIKFISTIFFISYAITFYNSVRYSIYIEGIPTTS